LDSKYQLVRNILAVGVKNGETSPANGHAMLIYDERNPAFQASGSGYSASFQRDTSVSNAIAIIISRR
jgi:hypothetical protein